MLNRCKEVIGRLATAGRRCGVAAAAFYTLLGAGSLPLEAAAEAASSLTPEKHVMQESEAPNADNEADERNPDYVRALPGADVIIDAGHGGVDGGAYHGDVLEKTINLDIAKKVYALLNSQGVRTVLNRSGDYALSDDNRWHRSLSRHQRDLSQRSQLTKEIRTKLLISLHVNWTRGADTRGPLVLHQNEGQSALLAFCIQDALNRQQHTSIFPRLGKPFYLLNIVKQPAVIIEMGFISNERDRLMLTNERGQLEVAASIASGVRNYILLR